MPNSTKITMIIFFGLISTGIMILALSNIPNQASIGTPNADLVKQIGEPTVPTVPRASPLPISDLPPATATPNNTPTEQSAPLELEPTLGSDRKKVTCTQMGQTFVSEKDGMEMVCVPEGEFLMGTSDDDKDPHISEVEKPQHAIWLDSFWIDKTEVTISQYSKCVEARGCNSPQGDREFNYYGQTGYDNYPVISIDWFQAKSYCSWAGKRLPSEAEWEKAARGTDGRPYPWGENINCKKANWVYCEVRDISPVGIRPDGASPYGALDMAGNVWEWVNDGFDPDYYKNSPYRNPTGPDKVERVTRGGSYFDEDVRVVNRALCGQNNFWCGTTGFRCVKSQ